MTEKKSFILYADMLDSIEILNMGQRGVLFTAILCDQGGREMPDMDAGVKMAFAFIKCQLDKNAAKYAEIVARRREAGQKGGLAKASNAKQNLANLANASNAKQMLANPSKAKQTLANLADNDNDNVNDNVNDNDNVITDELKIIEGGMGGETRSADAPRNAKEKPVKHKYGENKNVLLTDEELASLQERFPADWENRIENLSWYLSNHKDKYTSHYKTILAWARSDQQKAQTPYKSKTAQELDASYKMLDDWVKNGVE